MIKANKFDKVFGTVALLMAILIVWHWGLVDEENQILTLWIVVDILFVVLPIIYFLGYGYSKGKGFDKENLSYIVLTLLLIICVVAIYQVLMGKVGVPSVIWDYLNAFSVVAYSFIAGKYLLK